MANQIPPQALIALEDAIRLQMKDLFLWAYERSAARYAAVRQSLGEPDPFKLRYRTELREIIADAIRATASPKATAARIGAWAIDHIDPADRDRFIEITEAELASLHEDNFARYQIRPSEFAAWRKIWEAK